MGKKGNSMQKDGEMTSAIKCGAFCKNSAAVRLGIEGKYSDNLVFSDSDAREN
jgi:hypothetical protein